MKALCMLQEPTLICWHRRNRLHTTPNSSVGMSRWAVRLDADVVFNAPEQFSRPAIAGALQVKLNPHIEKQKTEG
jgi:hypothetical protein